SVQPLVLQPGHRWAAGGDTAGLRPDLLLGHARPRVRPLGAGRGATVARAAGPAAPVQRAERLLPAVLGRPAGRPPDRRPRPRREAVLRPPARPGGLRALGSR